MQRPAAQPPAPCRVHQILPDTWDWTGAAAAAQGRQGGGRTGSTSDLLESGDLQQVYFHLLHLLVGNELLLLVLPHGELLSAAMSAVVKVCFAGSPVHRILPAASTASISSS